MKRFLRLICFSICVCCTFTAGMVNAEQQTWNPVGSSNMRWTVFKVYNITLLSENGRYQAQGYPQALDIRYFRSIRKEDLVKATGEQWEMLDVEHDLREGWLSELLAMWPDISANDRLRIEVDVDGRNRFFHNDAVIGAVDSAEFSEAFLNIWLSPNTSRPKLRNKLINGLPEKT